MQLACPSCRRLLEYSGERPSFCAYCGHSLQETVLGATAPLDPEALTLPPTGGLSAVHAAPETVGGYRLLRPLGRGGMGAVYEAEDAAGRRVALKLVSPEFVSSREAVERFRQEGRLASTIAHPRCVFVLAADEEDGRPYIVMELMPGSTLADRVAASGPLPPAEAVATILDVIDGLEEAHRQGVIHRDVKPSNCFVDADGRVKVGDFGLAKSLEASTHLTRTGSFLGTPLFASPEQIRRDPVDEQTDVYSAAATLYFLLTGKAPFQGGDAAATLARIVSDPAPSARGLRPEVPLALDRVVQRGLERQRERRYRGVREFREALLPFLPGRLSATGLGVRFVAFVADYVVLKMLGTMTGLFEIIFGVLNPRDHTAATIRLQPLISLILLLIYFGIPEGWWGCSLGKWLLRLRVTAVGGGRPGLVRGLGRAAAFALLFHLGGLTAGVVAPLEKGHVTGGLGWVLLPVVLSALGIAALLAPMRTRNGYRGLHGFVTGTRVVRLPWPERPRTAWGHVREFDLNQPAEMPAHLGPYRVVGAVRWTPGEKVLLAEDPGLRRRAWLWLRPESEPPLSEARHSAGRVNRPRWLAGGIQDGQRWDAFLLQGGCILPDLVAREGRFGWPDVRVCLEQLTDELTASLKDGTLPASLDPGRVWVQPNGGVQLLDFALANAGGTVPVLADRNDDQHALELLRRTAVLLLEGRTPAANGSPRPVEAPMPTHARRLLDRLFGERDAFHSPAEFQAGLAETRERAVEVDRPRRTTQLTGQALLLGVGLICIVGGGVLCQMAPAFVSSAGMREAEKNRPMLQGLMAGDLAAAAAGSLVGLGGALQLNEDARLYNQTTETLESLQPRYEAWLQTATWSARESFSWLEAAMAAELNRAYEAQAAQRVGVGKPAHSAEEVRRSARWVSEFLRYSPWLEAGGFFTVTALITGWPAAWVVWAFLIRGGLSYRFAGIRLVRSNGRPARRVQCAWRALLVWAPVTGLFLGSLWLVFTNLSAIVSGLSVSWGRMWLPGLLWWTGLLLLPAYVALALWRPARALHDRLSGVWLVPR